MSPRTRPNAPRFHALWEHLEGPRILVMKKDEWGSLNLEEGQQERLAIFPLSSSPLDSLHLSGVVLAAVARRTGKHVRIEIYRSDHKDAKPVNLDTYEVWEGLPPHLDVPAMIVHASTDADPNFQEYAEQHVFLVKKALGKGHWLDELPPDVVALISKAD